MNWTLLQNSLAVAGLTTIGSVGLGFVAALWLSCLERRARLWWLGCSVMALMLPPFLVTSCWLHWLGLSGVWRNWLPLNIYSLGGTVWILTLLTWPISLLALVSAWQRVETAQLESDPALRGVALIRWLLWPIGRPFLGVAAVLTFVLALNNFTVPALLQVKVFPAELWVRFSTNFDYGGALALSWPLVAAPVLLLLVLGRARMRWPLAEGTASARALRRQLGGRWFWLSGSVTASLLVVAVGLPLMQLVSVGRTWTELPAVLRAVPLLVGSSFGLAAAAASACVALGLALWRWNLGLILWVPFLVPGVLLGIALIFVLNRPVLEVVYHSTALVVVAWTLRYGALAWALAGRALRSVDSDLTEAARLSGAAGWTLLRQVQWPQIAPHLAGAWYLTYLLCLWDVETLTLIYPPGGETLALRIFNLLHYGHNSQVNALCLLLLGLAVAPLAVWGAVQWLRNLRVPGAS